VDPARVDAERVVNPHFFYYREGYAVDEMKRPLDRWLAASASYERLRIHHYWAKSEEEALRKFSRLRPDTREPYPDDWSGVGFVRSLEERAERDTTILRYLPELREALRLPVDRRSGHR
jgi:hypothetical protein